METGHLGQIPPPAYAETVPTDYRSQATTTSTSEAIKLTPGDGTDATALPGAHECIIHLKFLTALAKLRHNISNQDGIFGIEDGIEKFIDKEMLSEKRWAVYVTRAVDRFEAWFRSLPNSAVGTAKGGHLTISDIEKGYALEASVDPASPRIQRTADCIPPPDVLMVLHSAMLNPVNFLDDCLHHNKMTLWHAGFPWDAVDACIEPKTFAFVPDGKSVATFEAEQSRAWENENDVSLKRLPCPACNATQHCDWIGGYRDCKSSDWFEADCGFPT
jgi:hypothetical protein